MDTNLNSTEISVINALYHNNYGMMHSHEGLTWADTVNESSRPSSITGKQLRNVLASLAKKGWIKVTGFGRDDTVQWASQSAYNLAVHIVDGD